MVHMGCSYLMGKQMPHTFWFYAITRVTRMTNCIPGIYSSCLISPFLLVHVIGHDERTWILIFSLCYFYHKRDGDQQHSKHLAHTIDGVVVGHSQMLNDALMVYNSRNKQYYKPDKYWIDPYPWHPSLTYPDIKNDVAYSAISSLMIVPKWKRGPRQALRSSKSILLLTCYWLVWLWTFFFLCMFLCPTAPSPIAPIWFCLTTAPLT